MNLSSLSVRRGVTFSMLFLGLFGLGVFSLSRLQLDLFPDMTFPAIVVITNYSGASPEDVETLITERVEEGVATAKGIEKITSQSKQSASIVLVEFGWDKDMDQAETDVRRKLDMVTTLPDDASDPLVIAMDPSMQPVVILALTGDYSLDQLRALASDRICERVERLDGIAACEAIGGLDREIRVSLNPETLAAYGIGTAEVLAAIGQGNLQEPGGTVEQNTFAFNIQTQGKYRSLDEIRDAVVTRRVSASGKIEPILLGQIAEVEDTFKEETRRIEVDNLPSVWIVIRKQSGFNTVRAAKAAMAEIDTLKAEYGDTLAFGALLNQADFINNALGNLSSTSLVAVVITFLVLLVILRSFRSAVIVATAIPLSVVTTFFVMDQAGMTLNVISMAGLALAVGMLVDNAIVVLENIFRLRQEGTPTRDAAVTGAGEVTMAVTASTLTTVAVFVPILFVPGIAGVIFKDMAVTICFALFVSLFVAVSFIPLAISRLYGKRHTGKRDGRNDLPFGLTGLYGRLLGYVLAHRWVVLVGLAVGVGLAVVAAMTMPTDFMAQNDQSQIEVSIKAPVGSNINETDRYARDAIEQIKKAIPASDRKLIAAEVGAGVGFSAIFSEGVHSGKIRIPLVKIADRDTAQSVYEEKIRERLVDVPDLTFSIGRQSITGATGDMEIDIHGHDLQALRRVGKALETKLAALPDMAEVQFSFAEPTPQINVTFKRDKMARMGILPAAVSQTVATLFLGKTGAFYSDGDDEHAIYVRYDKRYRYDVEEIARAPIATPAGKMVPLANIAEIGLGPGPVSVSRIDQQRVVTITCVLKDTYTGKDGETHRKDLGGSIDRARALLAAYDWPPETGFDVGGTAEDFIESFQALGYALIVSIFLVYMVMASQFESFREPFIILFTMPLALIGVVVMLSVTQTTVDVSALIGVIMLVGIVVNNGIVMVDAANQRRNTGADKFQSVLDAARTRLRPVLLTSLTTICSMIPLALGIGEGSETWSGMARSVIGGLTSATFLTLIVIPVFYTIFAKKEVKV